MKLLQFSLQTGWQPRVHSGASRENNVFVELWPNVNVTALDGVKEKLSNALSLNVNQVRLEQCLRSLKPFPTNLQHTTLSHYYPCPHQPATHNIITLLSVASLSCNTQHYHTPLRCGTTGCVGVHLTTWIGLLSVHHNTPLPSTVQEVIVYTP